MSPFSLIRVLIFAFPVLSFGQVPLDFVKSPVMPENAHSVAISKTMAVAPNGDIWLVKKVFREKMDELFELHLEVFDHSLQKKWTSPVLPKPWKGQQTAYLATLNLEGKLWIAWTATPSTGQTCHLLLTPLEGSGELGAYHELSQYPVDPNYPSSDWSILHSPDNSKFMVYRHIRDRTARNLAEGKTPQSTVCEMFDSRLNLLWRHFAEPVFPAEETYTGGNFISNDGQAIFHFFSDLNTQKTEISTLRQSIWVATGPSQPITIPIDPDGNFKLLSSEFLKSGPFLEMFGTYADFDPRKENYKKPFANPDGTYYIKINLNNFEIEKKVFSPFSDQVFNFLNIKKRDRAVGIPNLDVREVVTDGNGNRYMVLEETNVRVSGLASWSFTGGVITTRVVKAPSPRVSYVTGSLLLIPVSDGLPGAPVYVPRRIRSSMGSTWGHFTAVAPTCKGICLIYNDSPKNRDRRIQTDRDVKAAETPTSATITHKEVDVVGCFVGDDRKPRFVRLANSIQDGVFADVVRIIHRDDQFVAVVLNLENKYQVVKWGCQGN